MAPLVVPSGHLGLGGLHPPAPSAPVVQFLAATGLQVRHLWRPRGTWGWWGCIPQRPER